MLEKREDKPKKERKPRVYTSTQPHQDTPLQQVVNHFFDLQGFDPAQRKVAFSRHVRDASALLKACGSEPKKAKAVLDALQVWSRQKKLDYTIGTALKRWKDLSGSAVEAEGWDEKMKRVDEEVRKYKAANGIL